MPGALLPPLLPLLLGPALPGSVMSLLVDSGRMEAGSEGERGRRIALCCGAARRCGGTEKAEVVVTVTGVAAAVHVVHTPHIAPAAPAPQHLSGS